MENSKFILVKEKKLKIYSYEMTFNLGKFYKISSVIQLNFYFFPQNSFKEGLAQEQIIS